MTEAPNDRIHPELLKLIHLSKEASHENLLTAFRMVVVGWGSQVYGGWGSPIPAGAVAAFLDGSLRPPAPDAEEPS